jgi:hypothetical protein
MQYDDLVLDGHRYDVTVLALPLEYLHFLSRTGRSPGAGGSFGLEAILLRDLEWSVEARATDVHRSVQQRKAGTACSCGLVMDDRGLVASRGHRDLRTWRLATAPYVVSTDDAARERFAVVCPVCGLGSVAGTTAEAHDRRKTHDCSDVGRLRTPAELLLHLGRDSG